MRKEARSRGTCSVQQQVAWQICLGLRTSFSAKARQTGTESYHQLTHLPSLPKDKKITPPTKPAATSCFIPQSKLWAGKDIKMITWVAATGKSNKLNRFRYVGIISPLWYLCVFQSWAAWKWCTITFAVSKSVPAELGTSFPQLIFIRTAIDFNDLVNRHTPNLLSASPALSCPLPLSSSLSSTFASSCVLFFPPFLLSSLSTTTSINPYCHISHDVLTRCDGCGSSSG